MRHDPHSGHLSGFFLDLIMFVTKAAATVNLSRVRSLSLLFCPRVRRVGGYSVDSFVKCVGLTPELCECLP
jgi:hypothetical protein